MIVTRQFTNGELAEILEKSYALKWPDAPQPGVLVEIVHRLRDTASNRRTLPPMPAAATDRNFRIVGLEEAARECDRLTMALDNGGNLYRREASASQCAAAIREIIQSAAPVAVDADKVDAIIGTRVWFDRKDVKAAITRAAAALAPGGAG